MTTFVGLPKVAILDDYQRVAFVSADWSSLRDRLNIDVYDDTLLNEEALVQRLKPYNIICAMRERTKFSQSLLERLPNLRFISTTGSFNRGIDIKYAEKRGIVVSGTGSGGNSTLEHIWALILATARHISLEDKATKAGRPQWQSTLPVGLAGRTLGLIGIGRLGGQTAKIAKAFGINVIGWSPNLTPERASSAEVTFIATKEELLKKSDFVSIHMVLSEKTYHLITKEDLALLKPTAIFINTSRGPLVDEQGLIDVLREGKIAGAGLDVFEVEPLPLDHPLRNLGNVTLTPHMGYVSDDNYKVFWGQTVENIIAYLDGKPQRIMFS